MKRRHWLLALGVFLVLTAALLTAVTLLGPDRQDTRPTPATTETPAGTVPAGEEDE